MQAFWNKHFQGEQLLYGEAPNQFIKENLELLLPMESVLCLGEGEGRNAIFLADKGLSVEALDVSDVALFKLRERARAHYLHITLRHTLLAHWNPSPTYGAIVCTYLHLPKKEQKMLFEKSLNALKIGGIFIAELFSESQKSFHSGGEKETNMFYTLSDIAHTLKALPCSIQKLAQEIVLLNEGTAHTGRASVIRVIFHKLS